jgi:hypothetical protein
MISSVWLHSNEFLHVNSVYYSWLVISMRDDFTWKNISSQGMAVICIAGIGIGHIPYRALGVSQFLQVA